MSINVNISYNVSITNRHFSFYFDYYQYVDQLNKDKLKKDLEDYSTEKLYLGLCDEFPEEKEELKEIRDDRDALIYFIMNKIDAEISDI